MNVNLDRRRVLRGAAGGLLTGFAAAGALPAAPARAERVETAAKRRHDRVLRVANAATDHFDHGWRTGDWQPFPEMLTDEFPPSVRLGSGILDGQHATYWGWCSPRP